MNKPNSLGTDLMIVKQDFPQYERITKIRSVEFGQCFNQDSSWVQENTQFRSDPEDVMADNLTREIDSASIFRSKWATRQEESFKDEEFLALKAEICSAGGNIQPIKIRPLVGQDGKFEIVFGHRRHQACLELGLPVLAMIENLSEQELFSQMDRENRSRKDLRPYEQGLMYAKALDEGLFPSARKLAQALGVDLTNLSRALSLARLPSAVLNAFINPLDLQYRWAIQVAKALQRDREKVLKVAKQIQQESPRPASKETLDRLTGVGRTVLPPHRIKVQIYGDDGETGSFNVDETNRKISINIKNIDPEKAMKLQQLVASALSSTA